ncbi:uncharacterized protein LOC117747776 [Cyclopterus lumpus]|uniref:Ig-like domain-containing protein n=1 Tax=Cyclopterus lumpus TaxID=8103 RepID=A0A8C3G0D6_CYCLU|nr:uncharacterized protein LOC117747776 [Cyclopterus lumpus]
MALCFFLLLLSQICQVPAVSKTSGVSQDSGIITANVGQDVTLKCICYDYSATYLSWYKQKMGGKPIIISTGMQNAEVDISPAYKERFRILKKEEGSNHLVIKDLFLSDSATYYCGTLEFHTIEFGQGAFLHVKASSSNIGAVVHQPALERLRTGDSLNLMCTIGSAGACAGEKNLYWIRPGAAQPSIMHHKTICDHPPDDESHMKNCTSYLSLKTVSSPDAGVYYCALASCGEIVFGNGTRVEIAGGSFLLVYCLSAALAVFIAVLLVLAFVAYKLKTKSCAVCKGTVSHLPCSEASDVMNQDADIYYAALSLNRTSERRRTGHTEESVCVYARVKSRKQ